MYIIFYQFIACKNIDTNNEMWITKGLKNEISLFFKNNKKLTKSY